MDIKCANLCACGCGRVTNRSRNGTPRRYLHGHNRRGSGSPDGWLEQGMRFVWVDGKKRPLHRVIMEEHLGRKLRSDEIVRHRDGDLLNNDLSNLVVVSRQEHFKLSLRAESKQPWTDQETSRALELYRAGSSIDQVARALGRSYHATRRLLSKWIWLRKPHETTALKQARAEASSARFSSPDPPSKPSRSDGENPAPGVHKELSDEAARRQERLRRLRTSAAADGEDRPPKHSTGRSSAPLIEHFVRALTAGEEAEESRQEETPSTAALRAPSSLFEASA